MPFAGLRAPLAAATIIAAAIGAWALHELGAMEARHREETRRFADAALLALEMSLAPPPPRAGGRPGPPPAPTDAPLRRLVAARPRLLYGALLDDGVVVAAAGEAPGFSPEGRAGELAEGGRYFAWRPLGGPGPRDRPLPAGAPPPLHGLVAMVGVDDAMPIDARRHDIVQMAQKLVVAALGGVALVAAWIMGIRGRELAARLQVADAERRHLEDLSLAASGLAHETRNPLGIIRGLAQRLAQDPTLAPGARARAEEIVDEADRAAGRLGDFMTFAKVMPPAMSAVDARPILERAAGVVRADAEEAGVAIRVEAAPILVHADGEMLMQILLNLVLNAIQACRAGGALTLALASRGATARIVVSDTGEGIAPALLADVFKPYVTGRPGGHGLGLSIVRRLVEEQGWTIGIDSVPGAGTRVSIDGIQVVSDPEVSA